MIAFSWGYWGWGNAARELVSAVDAAERRRGFQPPVFVDIRFKRAGRAPGFQGRVFEQLVGWRRYRWMQSLGNSRFGRGGDLKIAFPQAVAQLLDLILDAHDRRTRVIYFCACEPGVRCHRREVSKLLKREARLRGVKLDLQEWPGGEPAGQALKLKVSSRTFDSVAKGAKSLPLLCRRIDGKLAALAWGTPVCLTSYGQSLLVAAGPAQYRNGWVLPLLQDDDGDVLRDLPLSKLRRQTTRLRRQRFFERT